MAAALHGNAQSKAFGRAANRGGAGRDGPTPQTYSPLRHLRNRDVRWKCPLPALAAARAARRPTSWHVARRRYALGRPYSQALARRARGPGAALTLRRSRHAKRPELRRSHARQRRHAGRRRARLRAPQVLDGRLGSRSVDSTTSRPCPSDSRVLGSTNPFFAGLDAGVRTMKEGGWRRLVVPAALAFGDAGLKPAATASRKAVPPGASLFVDVRLLDAGSGRCDDLIRVKGVKSAMCEAADVPMKRTPVTLRSVFGQSPPPPALSPPDSTTTLNSPPALHPPSAPPSAAARGPRRASGGW